MRHARTHAVQVTQLCHYQTILETLCTSSQHADDDAVLSATADEMVNQNEALPVNPNLFGILKSPKKESLNYRPVSNRLPKIKNTKMFSYLNLLSASI